MAGSTPLNLAVLPQKIMSKHDEWQKARKKVDTDYITWLYQLARYFAIPCLIIAILLILDAALPSVEKERVQVWRVDERVDRSYRRHDWIYGVTGKKRPRRTYLVLHVYREENGQMLRSTLDVSNSFADKLAHDDTLSVRTSPLLGVTKNVRLLRTEVADFTDRSYQALIYLFQVLWLLTPVVVLINRFEMRNGYFIAIILGAEALSLYYWYYFIRHLLS